MKLQPIFSRAPIGRWVCGVLCLGAIAAPAVAGFTPINMARIRSYEPNLVGLNPNPDTVNPSVIETLYGEENVRRVNDEYDRVFVFTEDVATFKVVAQFSLESHGYLSIANPDLWTTDLVLGLIPRDFGYDLQPPTEFVVSKEDYVPELRLVYGLMCSDPDFHMRIPDVNPGRFIPIDNRGVDQMVTFEIVGNQGRPDNPVGSYVIAWEDRWRGGSSDGDFQDFVVQVTGIAPVPEPASVAIVLLGAAMAGVACRRKGHFARAL